MLPWEAFVAAMARAAAPTDAGDVSASPPFAQVAQLLSKGGADADPQIKLVDLTLAVARLQALANDVHEQLLEVERRALAAGTNNSRASQALTDANAKNAVVARRRAVSALSIASAMLVSAVRTYGGRVTPKLTAPMSSGGESCNALVSHAMASQAPLFEYLSDEEAPAWTQYGALFGRSEAAADTSVRSGYVPRAARTSTVNVGSEVQTIEAAFTWVAREHLYAFAPRVSVPQGPVAVADGDAPSVAAQLAGSSSSSAPPSPAAPSPTSSAASRPATTIPAAFARPRPIDPRTHPALTRKNELRFVTGTVDTLFVVDAPARAEAYTLPLLRRGASEKLPAAATEKLVAALSAVEASANDVTAALAAKKLDTALGASWDASVLLEQNKDCCVALISACFRFGERAVLQRVWAALCASPPTEPACHVLREVAAKHGIGKDDASAAAPSSGNGRRSPEALPDADDPDSITVPDRTAAAAASSNGSVTVLRVGAASRYPRCFTPDMFGAATEGMARALRAAPADRRARLLKIFALVLRPLIKRREPPLPLSASSTVTSLCLDHTDSKDCQALYQAVRQSHNLDTASSSAASSPP